ncbi:hypothetical protein [uncultured Litoreibacter sp.]|uniref:spike base protein, RCAP_Rcc01079 family n=1 Tax=uncultured Litoreibacter sp. TaxID=1392394 RepID=UPI0026284990|nr:hypothetical protein [uncultured Litoreibacter sp.]
MDKFANFPTTPISPARGGAQVTPDDATPLTQVSRALYVGQGGDIAATLADGDTVTFEAVPSGAILPIRAASVSATGTTAEAIVALW